jgi:tetratricopeptide (TPR) repeat protein
MCGMPGSSEVAFETARLLDESLVGRVELIDELVVAADAAARGTGSIAVLIGEAGIGKTSVARVLAHQVRDRLEVSWGACVADQSAPPFWPWRALHLELGVTLAASDPLLVADQAVGAQRFERLTLLRDELAGRVSSGPRLHVIEDLQWADVASVLLLAHLGQAIADMSLLVVATVRTGERRSPQLDDAIEQVRRTSLVRQLPVLSADDIATLIRRTGVQPDGRLVALVKERTGGNPLFVNELLRIMPVTESAEVRLRAVEEGVPEQVTGLAVHRLSRLPGLVADALMTASVMGSEGSSATLAAAHGCDVEVLLDLLEQARAAHFMDAAAAGRWQFRHQLIRDAVYAGCTGSDRMRRHASVLEALAEDPASAASAVAHHALAALPLFDADRAVALAARAGEAAFAQHAYEEAVVWFTRALAAAPPRTSLRWRAELLVLSGEANRHFGDIGAARQAFVGAAELTDDPDLLARAALGHADPGADLGIAYRTDDAVTATLLERAIAAQVHCDSVTAVQLESRLAAELYFSDEPLRAREHAVSALDRARRLGHTGALVSATAVVHDAFVVGQVGLEEQLAESAQMLDWARSAGSVSALLTAHRARVLDLLAAGEMAEMDAEILAFRRLAEPLRMPGYLWWPGLWSAMRLLLDGRHDAAEERAMAVYHTGAASFPSLAFFNLSFLLFFLRREQGRLEEMEQATRDYAASHADVPALRVALTFLLAEVGRADEARGALSGFDEAALEQLHDRNWPASWFQLARVASIVGDRQFAATLLEPRNQPSERCIQVSLGTVCLGATDLATAWLLHVVGDLDEAAAHYRSAEQLNARIGARSWLAQTRSDLARLLVERDGPGDREAAAQLTALVGVPPPRHEADNTAAGHEQSTMPVASTFRHDGSVWELSFAGRSVRVPDGRGMRDLAHLLARPGEAVSVMELANDLGGAPLTVRGASALDERARREIRDRLRQFDTDEAEADGAGDGERAALVREQRQELAEAFARDFGLGGRPRLIGDPVERSRKTVSTRIRRAIGAIGRVHPELGRHLERSVDTGTWCAYRPAEPVDWRFK